jgi:hypothetical protein
MKSLAAILLPALAVASPLEIVGGESPGSNQVTIVGDPSTSGNGCRQGTVTHNLSPDNTVLTLGFDEFQTYIGPGTKPGDHTKNCQIHVNLKYPQGFTFSVLHSTYHGFAQLDSGVTGDFFSTYFFSQDAGHTTTTRTTITGGGVYQNGQVYTKDDTVDSSAVIWSPCGANGILNINNRIALSSNSDNAKGEITDDDATVAIQQVLHFQWKKC